MNIPLPMRIAYISYEAPPDTLVGGIGTYIGQAARALAARGHEVEVFAGSRRGPVTFSTDGYLTHLVPCEPEFEGRLEFPKLAARAFASRHAVAQFDVLEGPEFLAEAAEARKLVPAIPLVVKLHMSMTLIRQLNRGPRSPLGAAKDRVKAMLQPALRIQRWKDKYHFPELELPHLLEADEISAPCREIGDITARMWKLDRSQMVEVPYPFVPSPRLLEIPVETTPATVGYLGRLEQRKGVIDLARAIPMVLDQFPDTKFVFAGSSLASPVPGVEMRRYLELMLAPVRDRIVFLGRLEKEEMHGFFSEVGIVVLPSLWENFPNACLEAMAAGRAVVGSSAGGMAQQLDSGNAGLLIPPKAPRAIADAVCRLLRDRELRTQLGTRARARILSEYNADRIGGLMEQTYESAIRRRKEGARKWKLT